MIRSTKWIEGNKLDQPWSKFARKAIRLRLKTVWAYARLAAVEGEADPEAVHQLRVATRRARAALEIFADLLPKRKRQWINKWLGRLRDAAGEARDLDVLRGRLAKLASKSNERHLHAVVEQIAARRRQAQQPLADAVKQARHKKFKQRSIAISQAARWQWTQPEPTFSAAAPETLAPLVDRFLGAAKADLSDVKSLHRLRILGKQLRYAMELLAGAFDDSFRGELYLATEAIQERLGKINDHAAAITMFSTWSQGADCNALRTDLAELIADETLQLEAKRREFTTWWSSDRAEDLQRQFNRVLRTVASAAGEASAD